MKNERVLIAEWLDTCADEFIDIPWPLIHQIAGHEIIQWINDYPTDCVQMVLEKMPDENAGIKRLYVEFYQDVLRSEFALKFAK